MQAIVWILIGLGLGILSAIGSKIVDHGPKKMKCIGAWIIARASDVKNIVLLKRHKKVDIDLIALAKEHDVPIAVEKSEYDPTIVTWSNGRRSYHFADENSYMNNQDHGFEVMRNSTMAKIPLLPSEMTLAQKREKMKSIKSSKRDMEQNEQ